MNGSYKCCITIELILVKESMLLKLITVKNILESTIDILIKDSSFNNLFVMVVMIFDVMSLLLAILLLLLLKVLTIAVLANMMQSICWEMILDIYKMHLKEISIKNKVYNFYFDYLIKANIIETKNILVYEQNYTDFVIYFTRYDCGKSIRMSSLCYHELMKKKIEEDERKKYLMMDDYMLDKVSDKIKEIIGIKKFDDSKILIDKNDKSLYDITLKNVAILITCDNDKFYLQLFSEESFYDG